MSRRPPAVAVTRPLRIGIDAHAIGQRRTGNERFVANLIPRLVEASEHTYVLYFTDPGEAPAWTRPGRVETRVVRPGNPMVRIPVGLPVQVLRDRLDVLLVQYTAPPLLPCPVVTVVHDVAFARHPEFFSRFERVWMRRTIPATMRRARAVVTVSEFSSAEIRAVYRVPPERMVVAPNGVDPVFLDRRPRPAPVGPPFFMALGNLQPRKNLTTLIAGYRRLLDEHPETPEGLIIVGQEWLHAQATRMEAEDLVRAGRVRFTGYLPDEQVIGLLQRATAFAYPSVYEGFGLPVVEAMAAAVPTIVSDIPVMVEVAGDAAVRLAPRDPAAWAGALRRLATDAALRDRLAKAGPERAGRFTWERTAGALLPALEAAARPGRAAPSPGVVAAAAGSPPRRDRLTAVLVNYNSGSRLGPLLELLEAEVGHTVVVDNASSDGSLEAARGRPQVTVVQNGSNLGFAQAVNIGAKRATGDWIVLVNPDAHLRPGDVAALLRGLPPDVATVAPLQVDAAGKPIAESGGYDPTLSRYLAWALLPNRLLGRAGPWLAPPFPRTDTELDWVSGALLGIRREVFDRLGGLDERYFLYGEDADFGRRARRAGYRNVLRPAVRLHHEVAHGDPRRRVRQSLLSIDSLALEFGGLRRRALGAVLALGFGLRAASGSPDRREMAAAALPRCLDLVSGRERPPSR